jgi:flagellar export protein FliJ
MRPFRFRAQAALQLRRREHDQALVHLARVQNAQAAAARAVDGANLAMRDAETRLAAAVTSPSPAAPIDWYRSWRVRCAADCAQRQQQLRDCEARMQEATHAVTETYKRVRSLERLHDKTLAVWQSAARQEEQKTMDELAASKFVRRKDQW